MDLVMIDKATKMNSSEIIFNNLFFDEFPEIPVGTKKLVIDSCILSNSATDDIVLNEGLEHLSMAFSSSIMKCIKAFPSTLKVLELRKVVGDVLPELPEGLEALVLTRDRFKSYPCRFPESLKKIDLFESSWIPVPEFPLGLEDLDIWGMRAKYLPRIPEQFENKEFFIYD
jgi:hypothetical protein